MVNRLSDREAAEIVRNAFVRVHGRHPTSHEVVFTTAIASVETAYGATVSSPRSPRPLQLGEPGSATAVSARMGARGGRRQRLLQGPCDRRRVR